jgi:flagellar biosynthesis/type III secretory pathway protein FliH
MRLINKFKTKLNNMDNVTKEQIAQLIESLGNEVIYFTSIGDFKSAQRVKAEMDVLINDIQN